MRGETALEERVRLASDAARVGIWVWDLVEQRVIWESDRLYEMFGVPRTEEPIDGRRWLADVVLTEDAPRLEQALAHTVASGGRFYFYGRFRRGDGQTRWAELSGVLHRSASGAPHFIVGTGADVTERSLAEEQVRRAAAASAGAAEANAKFRTLFDQGTQLGGILALDGVVLEANRLSLDACGYTRADVIGKPFWECGWWAPSPELSARVKDATLRAAAGDMFKAETSYFVADGTERTVDLVLAPATDDSGRILFIAATGTDITDRKRAEEQLRLSDERLKLLVDNTQDYAVIVSDPDGVVLEWQGGAEKMTGYSAAEAVGRSIALIFTDEDREADVPLAEMAKAASSGRSEDKRWYTRKDGSRFFGDGVTTALRGSAGQLRGFGKVMRDATAQRHAEAALRESEERLRLLDTLGEATRSASDPAAVMAVTNKHLAAHLQVSRCAYAHVESDNDRFVIRDDWAAPGLASTVGVYTLDRFGPRAAAELRAGRTLIVKDVDRELTAEEGADMFRAIDVQAIICCPLVKEGQLLAMMAVHNVTPRDWTPREAALVEQVVERSWAHIERIRAAEALRDQDRRKDEFLATLAHELRNPLAPLRTGLQVLKLAPAGEAAETARQMMDRQLAHMVRLIDDLLDISRVSSGKFDLRRARVSVAAVLEHAVEASRPLIEDAGHTLIVRGPDRPLWLDGDLTRLAQIVQNLLSNAAKYTQAGTGTIELTAAASAEHVIIKVADNGIGIAADMLPAVFDMFLQVDPGVARSHGGLGIGLSLVRRLAEMHGGNVIAESAGVGRGSTFTVRLPFACRDSARPGEVPHAERADQEVRARVEPARQRILVVDDNVDGAELLATMLSMTGYDTRTAHDGFKALATARDFSPEVVFLDIGMPGMDGFEVARRVRADAELGSAVLIALTGWGTAEDKRRTREAGFDFHLTKPVEPAEVRGLLARLAAEPIQRT